jgi:hypothetical protein
VLVKGLGDPIVTGDLAIPSACSRVSAQGFDNLQVVNEEHLLLRAWGGSCRRSRRRSRRGPAESPVTTRSTSTRSCETSPSDSHAVLSELYEFYPAMALRGV